MCFSRKRRSFKSIENKEFTADEDVQPILPQKPLNFQIKQLEKLLSGEINPPKVYNDKSEVMLLLDSLRVMQRIKEVSCKGNHQEPVYDVPRRCYDK